MMRIFVVSCPRSGSTLLQSLLAAHPDLISFPESHFFARLYDGLRGRMLRGIWAYYLLWSYRRTLDRAGYEVEDWKPAFGLRRDQVAEQLVHLYDAFGREMHCKGWVEKTPRHLRSTDKIESFAPNAEFIHIIRDGRAVVSSLYRVSRDHREEWGGPLTIKECVERWNESIRITATLLGAKNHYLVSYEALTSGPKEAMSHVFEKLNLELPDNLLERRGEQAGSLRVDEPWKSDVSKEIRQGTLRKFYSTFDDDVQEEIEKRLDLETYRQLIG